MRRFLLLSLFLLGSVAGRACSCTFIEHFCDYVSGDDRYGHGRSVLARVEAINARDFQLTGGGSLPLIDIVIGKIYAGGGAHGVGDTITMMGQEGFSCAGARSKLEGADAYLLVFNPDHRFYVEQYEAIHGGPLSEYPTTEIPGCGTSVVKIIDGVVSGQFAADVTELPLDRAEAAVRNCVGNGTTGLPRGEFSFVPTIVGNPASAAFFVSTASVPATGLRLFDTSGRLVAETAFAGVPLHERRVNVGHLPAGVYLVVVDSPLGRGGARVVVR